MINQILTPNKSTIARLACIISLPFLAAAAQANQGCPLDQPCPLSGSAGEKVYINIKPTDGIAYICHVKSDGKSLKFSLNSNGDFKMTEGKSIYYDANPKATVAVKGQFKDPANLAKESELVFTKLPFSHANGFITCKADK